MDDKFIALSKLNDRLSHPKELGGQFLPPGSKKRDDILLVAEMPSMNEPNDGGLNRNFNFGVTARDKFFQEMLIKYGLSGVYVTDIVKSRDVPRKSSKKEILHWLPFLLKEICILDPKVRFIRHFNGSPSGIK